MIHRGVYTNNCYPFTNDSTFMIGDGRRLGAGVIYGASIQPVVNAGYGNLFISAISVRYLRYGYGCMVLADTALGDISTLVIFNMGEDAAQSSGKVYGSVMQGNRYCGCISATADILPNLTVPAVLDQDSFIFTPSVYRPCIGQYTHSDYSGGVVDYSGARINSFSYADDGGFNSDGSVNTAEFIEASADKVVKRLHINGVTIADSNAVITAANGCLIRVQTDPINLSIRVGLTDDLPPQ